MLIILENLNQDFILLIICSFLTLALGQHTIELSHENKIIITQLVHKSIVPSSMTKKQPHQSLKLHFPSFLSSKERLLIQNEVQY